MSLYPLLFSSETKTMGPNSRLVLIVSLSSLFFFFYSAQSLCVPRNFTNPSGLIRNLPPLPVPSPTPNPLPISTQSPPSPPPISTQAPPTPPVSASPPPLPAQPKPNPQPTTSQPLPPLPKPITNGPVDPLVDKTCRATDHPDLCFSSLRPYLHGGMDLITILDDEIKACKDRTLAASDLALKKIQDPQIASSVASSLKDCKDSYTDALDNLQQAEDAMKLNDIGTVNSMLSAALTDFGDCDDFVAELPAEQPISREDATLEQLTSNCLAIASLVKL